MDTQVAEAFERQPAGLKPVAAFRAAFRAVAGSFRTPRRSPHLARGRPVALRSAFPRPIGAASMPVSTSRPMKAPGTGRIEGMTEIAGASKDRPDGLRERKKARTRAAIREHALRLFRANGYQRTTVEKIAEAAEVSVSTFFRYFPTKEDVVLQDDMDTRMVEALGRQPADLSPLAAVRAAVRDAFASYTEADLAVIAETTLLTMTVPEIRARATDEFARTIGVIGEALAKRAGRPADDLAVRTAAGAIIGVMMSITMPWHGWSSDMQTIEDVFGRIDQALALLEAGLPL